MKLIAGHVDRQHEAMKRGNREAYIYPPPDDGREWMLLDDAAVLFGVTPSTLSDRTRKENWTRTSHHGVKVWLLKEEVTEMLRFLKRREQWYKRRRPKNWIPEVGDLTGMEEEQIRRVFLTSCQAAAYLGISVHRVEELARSGKLPVYVTKGMGRGRRYWFSMTNLRNHKEDEERLKRRAAWEKGKATLRQGIAASEVYRSQHRAKVYKGVPHGWITIREMAERLNISYGCAYRLRRRGRILSEQFTGNWEKRRPWFVHEDSVEEYRATEHYQKTQRQGKAAALSVIGKGESAAPALGVTLTKSLPAELSFGYTREELSFGYSRDNMPPSSLTIEW